MCHILNNYVLYLSIAQYKILVLIRKSYVYFNANNYILNNRLIITSKFLVKGKSKRNDIVQYRFLIYFLSEFIKRLLCHTNIS